MFALLEAWSWVSGPRSVAQLVHWISFFTGSDHASKLVQKVKNKWPALSDEARVCENQRRQQADSLGWDRAIQPEDDVVVMFGTVSCGKSSLLQAICHHLRGTTNHRIQVKADAGTTRDPFLLDLPVTGLRPKHRLLVDLPGYHDPRASSSAKEDKSVMQYSNTVLANKLARMDVAILVIGDTTISNVEMEMMRLLKERYHLNSEAVIVVRNKKDLWEELEDGDEDRIAETVQRLGVDRKNVVLTDMRGYDPSTKASLRGKLQSSAKYHAISVLECIQCVLDGEQQRLEARRQMRTQQERRRLMRRRRLWFLCRGWPW